MKDIKDIWKSYCEKLVACHTEIDVVSIPDLSESRKISLKRLYEPLRFSDRSVEGVKAERVLSEKDLNGYQRLVILGDPGSGKTTWVWHTVISLAEEFLKKGEGLIPVPIILRDYMLTFQEQAQKQKMNLVDYFCRRCRTDYRLDSITKEHVQSMFREEEKALLLLDGLDEVGGKDLREKLNHQIYRFLIDYPGVKLWCTSRIVGYAEAPLPARAAVSIKPSDAVRSAEKDAEDSLPGKELPPIDMLEVIGEMYVANGASKIVAKAMFPFNRFTIRPFDDDQIKQFIIHWYALREWNPRERSERTETLIAAIQANERIKGLARNPLTLSMIAMVHRKLARLPEERAELYRVLTESLLEHWELQKYKNVIPGGNPLTTKLRRMEHLAERMMSMNPDKEREDRTILIPAEEVQRIFKEVIVEKEHLYRGKEEAAEQEAANFLHYIKTRTGLLMERGEGYFSFVHLSFQEYLTASYLKRYFLRKWDEFLRLYKEKLSDSRWEETLTLFFEVVASYNDDDLNDLCEHLQGLEDPPLHLMALMFMSRPELSKKNCLTLVDMLCRKVVRKDYEWRNQLQEDWKRFISLSYKETSLPILKEYCWTSFLKMRPQKNAVMIRWAGHFITCEEWIKDEDKVVEFFNILWQYRENPKMLIRLLPLINQLAPENQKQVSDYILKTFPLLKESDDPDALCILLLFSEQMCMRVTGEMLTFPPLHACTYFLFSLARVLDRALDRALALDRARSLARALDQALARAQALTRAKAKARALARALALDLDLALNLALDLALAIIALGNILEDIQHHPDQRSPLDICNFWISLGTSYINLNEEEKKKLDQALEPILTMKEVQPVINEHWERLGHIMYRIGRDIKDEKAMVEFKEIIASPPIKEMDDMFRFLHLK